MAKEKRPTILVRWEGNQSKRYDNTMEEIWLSNVVAINKTAVVQPSLAQLHVRDIIEYEFVPRKGKAVQLWRGIVVSIDPDAERRAGSRSKKADTTTKGASRLSATVPDMERRATESLFEGLGSNKGKRKKHLSSSPLASARPLPKRKRDAGGNILFISENKADCDTEIEVGLPPSQDRIDEISGKLGDITKAPSLGVGLPSLSSLKTIAIQLGEIKETNELSRHSQEQLKHSLEQSQHSLRHSLYLQEIQSLELQEMKAPLLSLERTVKKLSEKSEVGLPNDVIDVDSLSSFSSNPPPTESSGSLSLPPAFGSPPPSYSGNLTSPGYYPRIPSFSGKHMRASSAPPTYRCFQQDYNDAIFFSENNYPQSAGLLELECGEPLPPSNAPSDEVIPPRNAADFGTLHQNEMPSRGASPTPSCQAKFIPTKCKSSDEVLSIYSFYKNTKDIGKLAIALAKYTYFGPEEMSQCTVMGRGNMKPLDPNKLKRLRENIRSVFPMVDDDEFKVVWDKCKESIAGACKTLQASIRYL